MIANIDHITTDAAQTNTFNRLKFNNICHRCGERGHYARECPQILTNKQIIPAPTQPLIAQKETTSTQMISTVGPPKVVQTITSEGQLPVEAWNILLKTVRTNTG